MVMGVVVFAAALAIVVEVVVWTTLSAVITVRGGYCHVNQTGGAVSVN